MNRNEGEMLVSIEEAKSVGRSFEAASAMMMLVETENAYLLQVDLPSVPIPIGEIISSEHELTVMTGQESDPDFSANQNHHKHFPSQVFSLHTMGGKIRSFYQEGVLYILLPKVTALISSVGLNSR